MAIEPSDRHRTTHRMPISLLLILITVGLPGCVSGPGTARPTSVRHPAANPTPPADPAGTGSDLEGSEPGPITSPGPARPHRQQAEPPPADGSPPGYQRSLACSGLLGLAISAVGLAVVGTRRRLW